MTVHVFDVDDRRLEHCRTYLSRDERIRAGAFRAHGARTMFAVTRGVLRLLLGEALGVAPERLRFGSLAHGKPTLAWPPAELRFSVSHRAGRAAVALCRTADVGIDLELVDERLDVGALGASVFGGAPLAHAEFFARWTRYEALAKLSGEGLGRSAAQPPAAGQSVRALRVGRGYAGALAVAAPRARVAVRAYPGSVG